MLNLVKSPQWMLSSESDSDPPETQRPPHRVSSVVLVSAGYLCYSLSLTIVSLFLVVSSLRDSPFPPLLEVAELCVCMVMLIEIGIMGVKGNTILLVLTASSTIIGLAKLAGYEKR